MSSEMEKVSPERPWERVAMEATDSIPSLRFTEGTGYLRGVDSETADPGTRRFTIAYLSNTEEQKPSRLD